MENWLDNIGQDTYEDLPEVIKNEELDEWQVSRLGKATGSNFGKFVKTDRKGGFVLSTSKTATDLIYKIAWERLLKEGNISNGLGRLNVSSQSMNHGNDYEGEAILKYIKATGNEVRYAQEFIELDDWIGGTPDGFIGKDGLIEVKCPWNGGNHLQSMLEKKIYNPDYIYQIQGYLWITDRKWCDFVTYDPDLIESLQLNIIRVERDEEIIEGIRLVMDEVKDKIQSILNNEKLK